jgi:hypothetical protein
MEVSLLRGLLTSIDKRLLLEECEKK